ncbi:MAG: hydrogenase maturation nickel metallochaperone HypA [bacterium]
MHEYSIVEQLVVQLLDKLKEENITEVREVHLRRGSTFAEGPLLQAFSMLTQGTVLQDSQLKIEEVKIEHTCSSCGLKETITADDLLGHLYVCSECGTAEEIDEAHGLELLGIVT